MSFKLVVKEEAREDIIRITGRYNKELKGLGNEFLDELDVVLEHILKHPFIYSVRYKQIRLGLLKRFKYAAVYEVEEKTVTVYAILSTLEAPKKVKQRAAKK